MPPPSSPARRHWPAAAALALVALALYAPVATLPFIHFDDDRYLTDNAVTRAGLTWAGVAWAFTTFHVSNWHPLTWLSHMLDVQLFGLAPGAHHLVSAGLHAANSALLFLVLARLTGTWWRSLMVAALFAVHPLHVESVAWVAERKDVLSTLFGLLALLAYARHAERPSGRRMLVVALAFAASLLSKPMWVTLPFLLLLLDYWPLRRTGPRQLVVEKLPLFALSLGSSVLTLVAQGRARAIVGMELGLWARLGNALVAYAGYLGKTFWPTDLVILYPHAGNDLAAGRVMLSGLLLLGISLVAARQRQGRPWLAVGWCWFLGTLVPVIGLVQVGAQGMADRYTYLPSIGLFIAVVWAAAEAGASLASWMSPMARVTGVGVVLLLAIGTRTQLGYWKSHLTLFRHAVTAGGEIGLAHAVLAEGLRRDGQYGEALEEARLAVKLAPGTARHWHNLGLSLRDVNRLPEARAAFLEALRLEPGEVAAWIGLSQVELSMGRRPEATEAALEATRIAPEDAAGWRRLAQVRGESGDLAGAIEADQRAVRLKPDYGAAWTALAIAYQAVGRVDEATQAFGRVTAVEPGNFVGWRNLGVHLAKQGQLPGAETALTEACRLRPDEAETLQRLGMVQLALGDRAAANRTITRLDQLDARRAAELRSQLPREH